MSDARLEKPASRLRDFRPDIEGLRFPLIVMVVLYHLELFAAGGVDGSIALSGAIGVMVIMRELTTSGTFSFGKFYARRARRLLPLATLVMVATLGAAAVILPSGRLWPLVGDALAAAGFGINFRLAAMGVDYNNESELTSPFQHYWSLAVEEQFWLLLPIFLVGMVWLSRRLNIGRWLLVAALIALTAGSFALSVVFTYTEGLGSWAYFGTHTRIWEFGLGALTALGASFFSRMSRPFAAVVSWMGLIALFGGSFVINEVNMKPGWVMLYPVVGVCMVIAGGCANPKYGVELLLGLKPIRFLGRLSYGWYLWHWPALLLMPYALGYERGNLDFEVPIALGTLVLAAATYYLVEKPFKSMRSLIEKPKVGLAWGARFVAVSVAAALMLATSLTVQGSAAPKQDYIDPQKITQLVAHATTLTLLSDVARARTVNTRDKAFGRCLNDIRTTKAEPCFLGSPGSSKTLVIVGSSLASQWIPALDQITLDAGYKLVVFAKGSCPAQPYSVDTEQYMIDEGFEKGVYEQCNEWRRDAYQQIAAMEPMVVVLSSRMEQESTPEAIISGVTFFRERGARVVLLGETPGFNFDVPDCVEKNASRLDACSRQLSEVVDKPKVVAGARAARKAGATVIDPLPWLCTNVCPPVVNEIPVYRDARHLSVEYAAALTNVLGTQLRLQ